MKRAIAGSVVLLTALHALAAGAQVTGVLTREDAERIALRDNPDARVAKLTADSARAQLRSAHAYPNPTAQVNPGTPTQYALTLPLDVGPQRLFRTRAASLGVEASEADARDAQRLVLLATDRAFFDVLLAEERERISAERRDLVRQLLAADSIRVRAGDLAPRALARSEVELARADADATRSSAEAQAARLTLAATIGYDRAGAMPDVAGDLAYRRVRIPSDSDMQRAVAQRADVVAAEARRRQSGAELSLARSAVLPTPAVSYVRQTSAPFSSGRYYALGVGLELPLLNWYSGDRDRARAGVSASAESGRRARLAAERDARVALVDLRTQEAVVERYQAGVVQQTTASVDAARYAYTHGASSLLEVLDALRAQQDTRLDLAAALHDYWVAVRTLELQTGMHLDEQP